MGRKEGALGAVEEEEEEEEELGEVGVPWW